MGANDRSHCVLISLPLCFGIAPSVFLFFSLNETLKLKMKHKYAMFHFLKTLIINNFKSKSET